MQEGQLASLGFLDKALAAVPENVDSATRSGAAIYAHAVHELSNYSVAVLGLSFPGTPREPPPASSGAPTFAVDAACHGRAGRRRPGPRRAGCATSSSAQSTR